MGTPLTELYHWNVWWLFLQGILGFAAYGFIFLFARRIVQLVQRGKMFSPNQVKWFISIGIGFSILAVIVFFVPDFTAEEGRIKFSFNFGYILAAIVSFIMAEIFQEGNRLNEESKLTV